MTQSSDQHAIWLTQDAFDKLQAGARGAARTRPHEIVEEISAARDEGDLKENGGYHAAREEQGKTEARIRQLEDMLRARRGRRDPGRRRRRRARHEGHHPVRRRHDDRGVPARRPRDGETTEDLEVYSPQSPLGTAILGAKVGETVTYDAPNGKELKVEIVDAVPYTG